VPRPTLKKKAPGKKPRTKAKVTPRDDSAAVWGGDTGSASSSSGYESNPEYHSKRRSSDSDEKRDKLKDEALGLKRDSSPRKRRLVDDDAQPGPNAGGSNASLAAGASASAPNTTGNPGNNNCNNTAASTDANDVRAPTKISAAKGGSKHTLSLGKGPDKRDKGKEKEREKEREKEKEKDKKPGHVSKGTVKRPKKETAPSNQKLDLAESSESSSSSDHIRRDGAAAKGRATVVGTSAAYRGSRSEYANSESTEVDPFYPSLSSDVSSCSLSRRTTFLQCPFQGRARFPRRALRRIPILSSKRVRARSIANKAKAVPPLLTPRPPRPLSLKRSPRRLRRGLLVRARAHHRTLLSAKINQRALPNW